MTIYGVLKKSVIPFLLMVAIVLFLSTTSNKIHADSEPETNLALNPNKSGYPEVTASYTCNCGDSAWSAVNGIYSYTDNPRDRWTNYGSGNATDWLVVDFGSAKPFNQLKLFIFDDHGGVQPPASYQIQYWNGSGWEAVTNQTNTPEAPEAALNTVNFDLITSSKVKIEFINKEAGVFSGLVELEVFLHGLSSVDLAAVSEVITGIEQLPIQAALTLADKPTIAMVRTSYDNLTAIQKSLVTNVSQLTASEAVIEALEAFLTDISVVAAFSNAEGNTITLKLSSSLDASYSIQAHNFQVIANEAQVAVTDVVYDSADSSGQTIKLTFSSPILLNETSVNISIQSGALKTSNYKINKAVDSIPVITFKNLDVSLDNRIGVNDIVRIIADPALHMDVNQDGIFDHEDIRSMLGQISRHFNS
jgi:hypothetical protein